MKGMKAAVGATFLSVASLLIVGCTGTTSALLQQAGPGSPSGANLVQATPSTTPSPAGPGYPGYGPGMGPGHGPGMGPGYGPGMGPGMMGGGGRGGQGYGPGMGWGYGPGMGPGMMGWGYGVAGAPYNQDGSPVTMDQAVDIANRYLASTGYTDLETSAIHEFTNGFEAEYTEKSTGNHAFEILIDKYTGGAFLEMGPNMMWNTKYSPMAGVMGSFEGAATTNMPVSAEAARTNAQQWLDANMQGSTLGTDVDTDYGYYEMDVEQGGKPYGEIDVNGFTGQVWYENWHGPMVQMRELQSGQ